jgi:hypothetical protein
MPNAVNDFWYITFIGTGVTRKISQHVQVTQTLAQNLPYGTHILKCTRQSSPSASIITLDGVSLGTIVDGAYGEISEFTFHQPKMPPIPEDAVVIADYMLMADFVVQTAGTVGHISKGVRFVSASRDLFYDASGATPVLTQGIEVGGGFKVATGFLTSGQTATLKLPYFGTDFLLQHYANRVGTITENLNSDVGILI